MKIYLRPNERIFINGAVIRTDRKVSLELMNDATFLLENHVLQKEDANTPLKQLYYVVQLMLMDPAIAGDARGVFKEMVANLLGTLENRDLIEGVKSVDIDVSTGKAFQALKTIRGLYDIELMVMDNGKINPIELSNFAGARKTAEIAAGE
ncbi:MAG: flagellar biosynthesis repressor FlbT [Nitratireductor sp.]|nr:flagellar biosynthesis repressor FlbT [Nitratireductor sp.]MCC0019933.1 flagellar biosynthesis repressor FlbT [Nitratireductor sp.]